MGSLELKLPAPPIASVSMSWRDFVGIAASVGCAIHCAAMPFVFAYLPAFGLSFLAEESFHKWMAVICFLIALAAFLPGIRKHGNWIPVGVGAVGLILITFAAFGLAGECCASCSSESTFTEAVWSAESKSCELGCGQCEHCAGTEANSRHRDVVIAAAAGGSSDAENLLSRFAPWVTPLGGMLLVGAHLMNHRFGCSCGKCCSEQ